MFYKIILKRINPVATFCFTVFLTLLISSSANAANLTDFKAGNIIDDAVFTNYSSMSIEQIQTFLNSKVPTCNTWHTGVYGTSGTWYGPPFTCLKDYSENGKTSSQIIYDAAQTYKINPQVLIVLLQKEQSLITDDWPASYQYKTATGYGCPDGADCNSNYFGFTNQVTWAAKMFRAILNDSPTWYTPYETGNNYIQYNPTASCGGTAVYIENRSTQALYNYTPYQPNPSALAVGYGLGDSCGAYGNRNFYLFFTDWFGSTHAINGSINLSKSITTDATLSTVQVGDTVTASYEVSNSANYTVSAGGLGVCARINGENYDFGFNSSNSILANGTITVSFSKTINKSGAMTLFACSYNDSLGGWASSYYPYNINGLVRSADITVKDNPLMSSSVTVSPSSTVAGESVVATVSIQNLSNNPMNIGLIAIAARDPNGNNVDFPADSNVTIPANSTYTYSKTRTFSKTGSYTFYVTNYKDNIWNESYPKSSNSSIIRSGTFIVKDNPLIISGVSLSQTTPAIGQSTTASMAIQNNSSNPVSIGLIAVAARDPNGNNVDFPADSDVTIPANSTYTYAKTRTFSNVGSYTFYVTNYKDNAWNESYPKSSSNSVTRRGNFVVKDNPLVTSDVVMSPSNPASGQPVTISTTIQNLSDNNINIGLIAVAARDPNGNNVDFPADSNVTIPANSTYTYSKTRTFNSIGKYTFFLTSHNNGIWNENYPKSSNGSIIRNGTFIVKDNPLIISGITIAPLTQSLGQTVTATMSIQNLSANSINMGNIAIAVRDPNGKNVDFLPDLNVNIAANSTYTYSKTSSFLVSGKYYFFVSSYINNEWNLNYPKSSSNSVIRSGFFNIN